MTQSNSLRKKKTNDKRPLSKLSIIPKPCVHLAVSAIERTQNSHKKLLKIIQVHHQTGAMINDGDYSIKDSAGDGGGGGFEGGGGG